MPETLGGEVTLHLLGCGYWPKYLGILHFSYRTMQEFLTACSRVGCRVRYMVCVVSLAIPWSLAMSSLQVTGSICKILRSTENHFSLEVKMSLEAKIFLVKKMEARQEAT